jgi:glycosyltransferase involved in cell wall biosynthesis
VVFRGWVPREQVLEFIRRDAAVLLFPSLHDQAGWIVGEALTLGLPAVCLDRGGPPALGAICVPLESPARTALSIAWAVRRRASGSLPRWDLEHRYRELKRVLQRRGLLEADP